MKKITVVSHSEQETQKLATHIGCSLKKGDSLALVGDFGSGKTVFVKGLAKGLRVRKKDYVCSPSFVILKIYRGRLPVYHFDLYRLDNPKDFFDIGFGEFVCGDGVSVIEWAQKMKAFLPKNTIRIDFRILNKQSRRLCLSFDEACHPRLFKKINPDAR